MSSESIRRTSTPESRRQLPDIKARLRSFLDAEHISFGDITAEESDRRRCTPKLVDFIYEELAANDHQPPVDSRLVKQRINTLYEIRYIKRKEYLGAYTAFERKIFEEAAQTYARHELPEIDTSFALLNSLADSEVEPLAKDALVAMYLTVRTYYDEGRIEEVS